MRHCILLLAAACGSEKPTPSPATPSPTPAVLTVEARSWDLADVSMLVPFPQSADLPNMLQTTSAGSAGTLLPEAWLAKVPRPFVVNVDDKVAIPALRVVAIRLDPCFKNSATAPCRPMVRMSWQPFVEHGGNVVAVDAALHSFYDLTADDFAKLADRLWKLAEPNRAAIEHAPLGVHPVLAKQGYGEYWSALKAALLTYCGEKSLARLTVMQLGGRTNVWIFSGIEKGTPLQVARIGSPIQTIAVHAQPPTQFDGGLFKANVAPDDHLEPKEQPEFNRFLRGTAGLDLRSNRDMLVKVVDTIRFLETPAPDSTSETVDCASCHIAQAARVWLGKYAPDVQPTRPAFDNALGFNLENTSPLAGLTNQLRAFGFIQTKPVISQRVIHESATVAAAMRRR